MLDLQSDQFQADIYPETLGDQAALTASDWLAGKNANPLVISLEKGFLASAKREFVTEAVALSTSETRDPVKNPQSDKEVCCCSPQTERRVWMLTRCSTKTRFIASARTTMPSRMRMRRKTFASANLNYNWRISWANRRRRSTRKTEHKISLLFPNSSSRLFFLTLNSVCSSPILSLKRHVEFAPNQHASNFACTSANFIKFGVSQQPPDRIVVDVAIPT